MAEFNQKIGEQDLNISAPNETHYEGGALIKQGIDLFKQEIIFLLDTEPYDVFASDFGSTLKHLIWRHNSSESEVKNALHKEITFFCDMVSRYDFTIDVKFMQGQARDICVIEIEITTKLAENKQFRTLRYTFS